MEKEDPDLVLVVAELTGELVRENGIDRHEEALRHEEAPHSKENSLILAASYRGR